MFIFGCWSKFLCLHVYFKLLTQDKDRYIILCCNFRVGDDGSVDNHLGFLTA